MGGTKSNITFFERLFPAFLVMGLLLFFLPINQSNAMSNSKKEPQDTSKKANALIHESSPYLLQHAYNPVDWVPWGDDAFKKAKAENKLVDYHWRFKLNYHYKNRQ